MPARRFHPISYRYLIALRYGQRFECRTSLIAQKPYLMTLAHFDEAMLPTRQSLPPMSFKLPLV
ncbi:hypothetical protein [Marinibactrum halimedae]|uniref:hypothetical protein n=1 Tax=Marinibactrum halimedae TaxID=1444977 RepID=UPI001E34D69D|nr:hypothetical protein [Marinibactrum halimedae]MCD9460879.1 hypothetical protein [Marinibactrum halimedae]